MSGLIKSKFSNVNDLQPTVVKVLVLLCTLTVLSACERPAKSSQQVKMSASEQLTSEPKGLAVEPQQVTTLFSKAQLKGNKILGIAGEETLWLVTSAAHGLILAGQEQQVLAEYAGTFEGLDLRENVILDGQSVVLATTVNTETGRIELFSVSAASNNSPASITSVASLPISDAQVEAQCLYRNPDDSHISLFVADALGMISERIIYDSDRQVMVNTAVRQFIGVPELEACVVDDTAKALYLAEEPVGVWRYAADAETDPIREPVMLSQPHGVLAGDVSDISLTADGSLWVLVADEKTVYRAAADGAIQRYAITASEAPETFSVFVQDNGLMFGIYDEEADHYTGHFFAGLKITSRQSSTPLPRVQPVVQTTPVERFGDAADDPVVWVNSANPERSLILGTDKRSGLNVYDLQGELRQSLPVGRTNNVDLRNNVPVAGNKNTLIAASNRTHNSISLFAIDNNEQVQHLIELPTNLTDVYGLCMYQSESGNYVFINDSDGRYQQYRIDTESQPISAALVREFRVPSQPEGCAADDKTSTLYLGEEAAGVWKTSAEPNDSELQMIAKVGDELVADVEGIDIYHGAERSYLVVSSQGNDSYVMFGLWEDYPLLTQFRVSKNLALGLDGSSETDGLAVTSAALPGYPMGILVVQDGRNQMPPRPQNFKVVSWESIVPLLPAATE